MAASRMTPGRTRSFTFLGSMPLVRTSAIPLSGFPWGQAFSSQLALGLDADVAGEGLTESQLVAVALKTLGSFDFEGHTLTYCVRHTAENFVSVSACNVREIRLEGVKTCLRLMLPLVKVRSVFRCLISLLL